MNSFTLEKTVELKLIGVHEDLININEYELSFTLITLLSEDQDIDYKEAANIQNISYTKVVTFLTDYVNNSLLFAKGNDSDLFYNYTNNFIILPELSEHHLIATLHSKLNSITDPLTEVDRITLIDKKEKLSYEYISLDGCYNELPTAETWATEFSWFDGCWWDRDDVTTFDRNSETQEQFDEWLKIKDEQHIDEFNKAVFVEIERAYREATPKSGEVVEIDFTAPEPLKTWIPVIVD